jgi:hypothetical protein
MVPDAERGAVEEIVPQLHTVANVEALIAKRTIETFMILIACEFNHVGARNNVAVSEFSSSNLRYGPAGQQANQANGEPHCGKDKWDE